MARTFDNRGYDYLNIHTDANDGKNLSTNADLIFYEGSVWILNQPVVSPNSIATNLRCEYPDEFLVYPNPTSGIITIFLNKSPEQNTKPEIINLQDKTVFNQVTGIQTQIRLHLNTLPKGTYFLVITSKGTVRGKIIELL